MAELYLKGVSGAYRDRGATFEALSYTERLVVWDGEHEAEAAAVASAGRAEAENAGAEAAQGERRVSEAARILDIAQFLADNPGIDISSLRPRVFPSYTYLPGEECRTCHGDRDGRRCLLSPECRFRYRAGFFTRQHGICPWCAEPLPGDLNTERGRGGLTSTVATDHIIPLTRGGPKHAEWNKQLLHEKCNTSKGNHVTAPALAVAAEHDVEVLDFLAVCQHPAPMPHGAVVHLFTPLIGYDGIFRSPLGRVGCRFRALCGHSFGADWFPVHGSPPPATCQRCREHRERLGAGNAPACAGECCAS
ncbi:MAG: HNH endonuclease [Streptosporangiaceae bacterium]